jgi:hypothetical protein
MRRCIVILILTLLFVVPNEPGLSFSIRWDKVHETITEKALKEATMNPSINVDKKFVKALLGNKGVRYPDTPEGLIKLALHIHKEGTLTFESHYGKKQYWHSMAFPGSDSARQIQAKIFEQGEEWYDKAARAWQEDDHKTAGQYIGRVLHMVQDSFSRSHVKRDREGRIEGFQDYGAQDPGKHAEADSPEKGNPGKYEDLEKYMPGAAEAMAASKDLLECFLRQDKKSFIFKMKICYELAPNAYPSPGGPRTEERYKKNESK